MDMKISGSGSIPAGEYDVIKISGSGNIGGKVKCTELHVIFRGSDLLMQCAT